ncbi:MAG: hypothetical protein QM811_02625 [Pirellulales bacterium]
MGRRVGLRDGERVLAQSVVVAADRTLSRGGANPTSNTFSLSRNRWAPLLDPCALISVLIGGGIMVRAFHNDVGGVFSDTPWPGIGIFVLAVFAALYWIPTALQRFIGEGFLLSTWGLWSFFGRLVWPVFWLGGKLFAWTKRPAEADADEEAEENLEEEIRGLVSAGQREGLIENDEREMIESVMELADASVAQIMTPRTEMTTLRGDLRLGRPRAQCGRKRSLANSRAREISRRDHRHPHHQGPAARTFAPARTAPTVTRRAAPPVLRAGIEAGQRNAAGVSTRPHPYRHRLGRIRRGLGLGHDRRRVGRDRGRNRRRT